jgi:hypothetical protein
MPAQAVNQLGAFDDETVAVVSQQLDLTGKAIQPRNRQIRLPQRGVRGRQCIDRVGLTRDAHAPDGQPWPGLQVVLAREVRIKPGMVQWLTSGQDCASMAERTIRRPEPRQEPSALAALAGICAPGP